MKKYYKHNFKNIYLVINFLKKNITKTTIDLEEKFVKAEIINNIDLELIYIYSEITEKQFKKVKDKLQLINLTLF